MSNDREGREVKPEGDSVSVEKEKKKKKAAADQATRRQRIITIILSLIIACSLWLYVMEKVNPIIQRSFSGIRVHVMNESVLTSNNLIITSKEDQYVRVRVSGKRRTLKDLDASDFVATADVSECTAGENYINVKVKTQAPVEIEKTTSSQIRMDVEKIVTEQKNVRVLYTGNVDDGFQPVATEQELSSVEVTGAESVVAKVAEVRTEIQTEKLTDSQAAFTTRLTAVDRKGRKVDGVTIGQKKMNVSAQLFVQKEVELRTSHTGQVEDGYQLVGFEVPESIRIALPVEEIERVYSVTAEAVDITSIKKNTTIELNLNLPGSAVLAEGQGIPKAVVKVAKIAQQTIKYDTDDIEIKNLPSGRELSFSSSNVDIVLTGTATDLSAIEKDDIKVSVDASYVTKYTVELPLIVDINADSDNGARVETEKIAVTVR